MYDFFNQLSNFLTQPFLNLGRSTESIPILSAFFLGIVGALVPCQITGNLGAVTVYGNKSIQKGIVWMEVVFFILGKMLIFSVLGLAVWILGKEFQSTLTLYFPWIRRMVGPMLMFIGLFMMGLITMKWSLKIGEIPEKFLKKGKLGAFLLGISLSLGFCPTMFLLFFGTLMPLSLSVSYGAILPSVFTLGTSLPLLIAIFLIWYFEFSGQFMKKKWRKVGFIIQKIAGLIMVMAGFLDTLTYW
ncbi:cytochrome C biosynthesis protein [Bacillus sp. OG2]|nr:cytochrome C biosynthesis protein [Bacillus sp. OG2]